MNPDFRADLHCHTTCSDGTATPTKLIALAKECGLSGLAITDHDTTQAFAEATLAAQSMGIHLGTGAEFSSTFRGESVHILAYDFSLESEAIDTFCKRHKEGGRKKPANTRKAKAEQHAYFGRRAPRGLDWASPYRLSYGSKGVCTGHRRTFQILSEGRPCYDTGPSVLSRGDDRCHPRCRRQGFYRPPPPFKDGKFFKGAPQTPL